MHTAASHAEPPRLLRRSDAATAVAAATVAAAVAAAIAAAVAAADAATAPLACCAGTCPCA